MVIPSYNSAETLERTLEALCGQDDIEDAEIIVVDDGSTDDTAQRTKKFPARYFYKSNGGPASARNLGIERAQGGIVLFIDSDCTPRKGWLSNMTQPFEDSEIAGVKGIYFTRQRGLVARFVQLEFEERYLMLSRRESIDFVDSYSAAFRRDALLKVGGFDQSFPKADNEDVDLSYKLARAGFKMVFQPRAVVEHIHPDRLVKYLKVKFNRGFWRTAVYKRHPGKAVKDSYTPQTLKLQILSAAGVWGGLILGIAAGIWLPALLFAAAMLLLALIFMFKVFRIDPGAAVFAPIMLFLRATCFIGGIAGGILSHFVLKEKMVPRFIVWLFETVFLRY